MNIKIEIEVTPEELRRFLGLPDVAGMQEDMVRYMRDKFSHSVENFDPATFVRESVKGSKPWKKLTEMANSLTAEILAGEEDDAATAASQKKASKAARSKSASGKPARRRSS